MSKSFQKWMIDNGNAISTFSSSTKKTVNVLKGLCASLASMGADMIITMGLNGIVTFIDNYANRVKYAQEGLENFNSNVTESKKNLETQKNWIEEHGERYVELSRGVDNYGKNVSLTADEMSEYNSLTKDIESMFPNMISGYNDQNQAIVKMKGSVDELTESYKTNVEAAYSSTLAKSSNGFNDYKTAILLPKNRKEQISEIISGNTKLKDVVAVESPFVNDGENGLIKDVNGFITGIDTDILDEETIKQLQEETKNSEKTFDQLSSSLQQKIRAALTTANATIKSETSKVKPILEAFVYANGGKDSGFDSLDEEGKQVIRNVISCLDDNFYKQFDSDTDMASYFYSYFIDPLKDGLDNTDLAVKINTLFSINQNDYESYQDYINAVNRIINQIKELKDAEGNPLYSEDQINGLQNLLGIGKINNNGQLSGRALIDTIKGKYSGINGADDYIETLNEEELRVLYDLKPDEIKGFDDLKKAITDLNTKAKQETENKVQSKSFFQVWDSIGTSGNEEADKKAEDSKEKLLELAETRKLTEEAFKESYLANIFTEAGISIEEATKKINNMKSSADQLASLETGISSISSILGEKEKNWESKKAHNKGIDPKTLAGMPEDIKAQTKEYENFVKVLGTGTSQMDECYDAAIKLATAYVKDNNFLGNLTDESKDYYISFFKQLGIDNAESIINDTITANKEKQKYKSGAFEAATKDLTKNTSNESKDFIKTVEDEKEMSSLAKTELADLIAKERIFNSATLSTSEKVNELNKLAEAYWGVSDAIQISSAMGADPRYYDNPKDYDNAVKDQWDKTVRNKSNLVLGFSQRLSPINTNPKKQGKKQDKEQDKKLDKERDKERDKQQQNKNKSTQQIDWISRALGRLSSRLDLVKAQYDNLFNNKKAKNSESLLTLQNKNLNEQYKLLKKTAKDQGKAQKRYSNKAKSVQISNNKKEDKSLKKAVREGRINVKKGKKNNLIAKYGEEKAGKIQEYQDWYDKAKEAEKNKINAQTARRQNRIQKYQNKADNADKKRSLAQARKENATTANAKKNYIKNEKKYIRSSYNNQIKAARREKDTLKVKQLKAEKKKELRDSNIEIHQNFADQHQSELDRFSAEKENLKTANEKNAVIDQEKISTSQLYDEKIKIAKLEGKKSEILQLQAEKTKALRDYDIEKHQNFADQYQSELDKYSAEKENLKTAEKNAVIDQEKAITSQLYDEKIEIARLAGNENEMAQLQAEKAKELRDFDIEKHQNLSNQYQAELDRYSAEKENLKTANEKNAVVDQEKAITSQLYREKIEIAKLEGNQSEELRLQAELSQRLVALEKEKFDNIVEYYKNLRKINEYQSNSLNNSLDELEARGLVATGKLYGSMMALNDEKKQNIQKELSELKQQHDKIKKDSPEWFDSLDSIQACEDSLAACIRNSIELGNAIRNIDWKIFEKSSSHMNLMASEFDLGIKLMSNKKMIDDKTGNFTKEGIATIGAYYSEMLLSKEDTNNMWSTLETMKRHIDNKDPGYTDQKAIDEYNEKYQEYIDLVGTEYDLQQHIIDMMKDKYKADLDHLQDIINKRKELLQTEKDSYDFQKNIEEKTKNIAVITKQLTALTGDDSEEAKTRIQQLQVSLDEANKDLQETEYQQWITDQQTMLDNLYNEYSDFIEDKLNDVDALLQEAVTFLGNIDMSESVLESLEEYYKLYGYKTTEDFQKIKDELGNNGSIVKAIGTVTTYITEYFKTQQKNQSKADGVATMVSKIGNVFEDLDAIERYKETQKAFDSLATGGENGENIQGYVASSAASTLESTGKDVEKIYADVSNFQNAVSSIGNTNDPAGYNEENWKKIESAYKLYDALPTSAKQLVGSHKNILDDRKYWYDQNKIIDDRKKKEEEEKRQTQINNLDYYIKSTYGASAAAYATNIKDASPAEIGIAGAIERHGLRRTDGYNSPNNYAISKIVENINSSGMGINIAPTAEALWNYMQNIGYSRGGIVDTLQKIPGMNGDDGWATLKRGEAVLTPEQTAAFQKLLQNLDVVNPAVDLYKNMKNVDVAPDCMISQSTGDINIDMSFPGVTNYEEFRQKLQSDPKIERMFKSMIWDKRSLSKYNTKMYL